MKTTSPSIEPLEARIAPAVTILNATTATYTDVDGDAVTIKVSSGTLTAGLFLTAPVGVGDQLQTINFSGGGFDNASLALTVKKSASGDGLAHIGYINSLGHDLGNVTIPGDLGRLDGGDGVKTTPALKTLAVRTMGRFGIATQAAGGNLTSDIQDPIGSLVVKGDVSNAFIVLHSSVTGAISIGGDLRGGIDANSGNIQADGSIAAVKIGGSIVGDRGGSSGRIQTIAQIGSITVGGSIVGGRGDDAGQILATGAIGPVKIGGDIRGSNGIRSGLLESLNSITSISVGGSVLGGSKSIAGSISVVGNLGPVRIAGDLTGGSGDQTGSISVVGNLGPVQIAGYLTGGSADSTGSINATQKITSVTIGRSVIGGSAFDTGEIKSGNGMGSVKIGGDLRGGSSGISGIVECAAGNFTSITVGGSVIGGSASSTGKIIANTGTIGSVNIGHDLVGGSITGAEFANGTGYIQGQRILSVTIGGSILAGTDTSTGALGQSGSIRAIDDIGSITVKGNLVGSTTNPAVISARGKAVPTATTDVAISSLTIGGRVERALILAGFDTDLAAANGDAQIGTLKVGGDWSGSSISAGVEDAGADGFGKNDAVIAVGIAGITARIAAIQIGGIVVGTAGAGDHFGFVAQQIGSFTALGYTAPLAAGTNGPIQLAPVTNDVILRELP